jgi:hypothetical protein
MTCSAGAWQYEPKGWLSLSGVQSRQKGRADVQVGQAIDPVFSRNCIRADWSAGDGVLDGELVI